PESELGEIVEKVFDFSPRAIIDRLGLLQPIYSSTASGGHFGRTPGADGPFPWEKLDDEILSALCQ
ncbi:MAG TPA: methionine adenosyltransferase domain-containing protein, partial [Candidatus Thalassarchaeaceae archaeon]|nr:methionine adenosyltransferase domain-containing protein [Candidatus Thalassarchaeaceae archaeon]